MSSHADPDVERLLHLARAGDADALGRVLQLYRNYLSLLARIQIGRRLQGKIDAADLVQETFMEAHRNFDRFQGTTEGEFAAWLRQILAAHLAHLLRRYLGTQRRDIRLERQMAKELDQSSYAMDRGLFDKQSSPSQRAARREQAVLLADTLEQLPEQYREVIILRHLEGQTFPEIAHRMRRTLPSVEKLWIRALNQLRSLLGDMP